VTFAINPNNELIVNPAPAAPTTILNAPTSTEYEIPNRGALISGIQYKIVKIIPSIKWIRKVYFVNFKISSTNNFTFF
jgi:hypothetical protein